MSTFPATHRDALALTISKLRVHRDHLHRRKAQVITRLVTLRAAGATTIGSEAYASSVIARIEADERAAAQLHGYLTRKYNRLNTRTL